MLPKTAPRSTSMPTSAVWTTSVRCCSTMPAVSDCFGANSCIWKNNDYPSEEQQFLAYKRVLESMAGKKGHYPHAGHRRRQAGGLFSPEKEENPAMGCRAIRICLTRPEIFKTQLRALYRASIYGNLGVMFPMITSVSELEKNPCYLRRG